MGHTLHRYVSRGAVHRSTNLLQFGSIDTAMTMGGPTLLNLVGRRSTATLCVLGGKNRGHATEEPAILSGQNYILSTSGKTAAHLGRHLWVDIAIQCGLTSLTSR